MNYTEKYHLPQWEETDRIMRTDFNRMCADMEEGLAANKAAAEAGVAEAKTEAAKLPYAVGTYHGSGGEITIELGFRPSYLIIGCRVSTTPTGATTLGSYEVMTAGNVLKDCVTFTDTGFIVRPQPNTEYPRLVASRTYDYIAFR